MKKLFLLSTVFLIAIFAKAQVPQACGSSVDPPAETCETACIYCGFTGIIANTGNYSPSAVPSFCQSIQNDMWLGFVASSAGATFTVTPSNCENGDGVQIALYSACGEPFLACNGGSPGGGNLPVSITAALVPGTSYYLLIDGYSADICDVSISIVPPLQSGPIGVVTAIDGPDTVCPGATVSYTANPGNLSKVGYYEWTAPPGCLINGEPGPLVVNSPAGRTVAITFPVGNVPMLNQQICVTTANSCFTGATKCRVVNVIPIPKKILPPVIICHEDSPYTLPWGQVVNISGTYQNSYTSYQGCDSLVEQKVVILAPILKNLGIKYVCQGGGITVCDANYSQTGTYSKICNSYLGCDSTVLFSVVVLDPVAHITGGTVICADIPITLSSSPSSGNKKWKNSNGQVLGTDDTLTVAQPGLYILQSSISLGGVSCAKSDTVIIGTSSNQPPTVSATGGLLSCASPRVILSASSPNPEVAFLWSGPNNYMETAPSDTVFIAGTYTVTVTNTDGCTAKTSAVVSLEDKTGTFSLSVNPSQINFILPALIDAPIPATIQNQVSDTIEMTWQRTFIQLSSDCASRVEDKIAYHPATMSTGAFSLAPGELAPLTIHLIDTTTTVCCGVVRLLCRNTCTLKDTLSMVYIAGCLVGTTMPEMADVSVFPNPGTGLFQISGRLPEKNVFLKVFALNGTLVWNDRLPDTHAFSLAGNAAGTYIVVLENDRQQPIKAVEVVLQR